ncbi:MAG: tRNA pseudouridine(55) synthase TruB [Oscillospiraceae bacterium]|nr:tRNA pseudouridine(55) synthase TruB [Oscillospiraceae bacterium]
MTGIIIVDKPSDWTSFDVCAKIRGTVRALTGEKKIKVGHGGTLDPLATGVLPVFIGREFTKLVSSCEMSDKEYVCVLRLGVTTDTQDISGNVLQTREVTVTRGDVEAALTSFRGDIMQVPPMYSAIQVNGQRLYDIARRGGEAVREPRPITIYESELLSGSDNLYTLRFVVSKGTYIRTLCHDIGETLGCGGTMESLRRTRVGQWRVENAVTMDDIARYAVNGELEEHLLRVV